MYFTVVMRVDSELKTSFEFLSGLVTHLEHSTFYRSKSKLITDEVKSEIIFSKISGQVFKTEDIDQIIFSPEVKRKL